MKSDLISKKQAFKIISEHAYMVHHGTYQQEMGMTLSGIQQALDECTPIKIKPEPEIKNSKKISNTFTNQLSEYLSSEGYDVKGTFHFDNPDALYLEVTKPDETKKKAASCELNLVDTWQSWAQGNVWDKDEFFRGVKSSVEYEINSKKIELDMEEEMER